MTESENNGKGALAEWQSLATFDATLPSGIRVKARFIDMERILAEGHIDISILEAFEAAVKAAKRTRSATKATAKDRAAESEHVAEVLRYKQHVVTSSIVEVSGKPVTLVPEDFFTLPEEDRDQLFRWIQRTEEVPLVGS